jgi:hypothetical protein
MFQSTLRRSGTFDRDCPGWAEAFKNMTLFASPALLAGALLPTRSPRFAGPPLLTDRRSFTHFRGATGFRRLPRPRPLGSFQPLRFSRHGRFPANRELPAIHQLRATRGGPLTTCFRLPTYFPTPRGFRFTDTLSPARPSPQLASFQPPACPPLPARFPSPPGQDSHVSRWPTAPPTIDALS